MCENTEYAKYESTLPFKIEGETKEEARITRKAYNEDVHRLHFVVFKKDLIDGYDATGNPKADKLFDIAWGYGHSEGLQSVEDYFAELVDLIR